MQTNGNPEPDWKAHLGCYLPREIKVLTFPDSAAIHAAIDLLWTDPLRTMPYDLAGGDSIVVPGDAVRLFSQARLPFTVSDLVSLDELTDDERAELRAARAG